MGLAGVTLGALVQSVATLLVGLCIGFAYGWKLSLVGLCQFKPPDTTMKGNLTITRINRHGSPSD